MSGPSPLGGGNPFEAIFGELAKIFSEQGSVNIHIARQMAQWLATGGQPEGNVEPTERMTYEELFRVAELNVGEATGLTTSHTGSLLKARPVTRGQWASLTLDAYGPLLEPAAAGVEAGAEKDEPAGEGESDPAEEMLGSISDMMGPLLVGLQAGSLVGHLAQRSFGQYDLPVPRPPSNELLLVPRTVNEFAGEWGLPADDLRLWVCMSEITHHAVLEQPHVRERMDALLRRYAGGFKLDLSALEDKLAEVDPTDPGSFQTALGDPGELLGSKRTPDQQQALTRIEALVAVVEAYVDHVMDTVGRRLIGSSQAVSEALLRRRMEKEEADRLAEALLGIVIGRAQLERGSAFVRGVLERAGDEGLARLWRSERELPTPAEVDAPGLWLERIDIPE